MSQTGSKWEQPCPINPRLPLLLLVLVLLNLLRGAEGPNHHKGPEGKTPMDHGPNLIRIRGVLRHGLQLLNLNPGRLREDLLAPQPPEQEGFHGDSTELKGLPQISKVA